MFFIRINPIHRRLAELTEKARRLGGYPQLSPMELYELFECLDANLRHVKQLHHLNGLLTAANAAGDFKWLSELEQKAKRTLRGG